MFSDHNYVEHIVLYIFNLVIGMIGDEANGWGTSHLEPRQNKTGLTLRTSGLALRTYEVLSAQKFSYPSVLESFHRF